MTRGVLQHSDHSVGSCIPNSFKASFIQISLEKFVFV